ncbi:hypothetical protein CEXT_331881 [Caerostris extrusa]|uniref:Uncharacterized protein n=1 Tax=Caerostris extrusa TaxID=172846 RepID=A0AAV4M3R8_CAEEX|nr:hypothetical protein CEXT_331881 [Caerostris extrusa]
MDTIAKVHLAIKISSQTHLSVRFCRDRRLLRKWTSRENARKVKVLESISQEFLQERISCVVECVIHSEEFCIDEEGVVCWKQIAVGE